MKKFLAAYKGVIVDIDDSEGINRVKIRVKGLMDGIPENYLPWARYVAPTFSGGSSCPPVKGKKVWVRFADGDINYPYYSGGVVESEDDLPENVADDRYVLFEGDETVLAVNTRLKDVEIKTAKYNTVFEMLIDLFLEHAHIPTAFGTPTGMPVQLGPPPVPILAVNFKTGSLV